MIAPLMEIGEFLRRVKVQLRFGKLSRAPLRLLRFELCGDVVECEWVARPADQWDAILKPGVGERHASEQALLDAVAVRNLLFSTLPGVKTSVFRVYRQFKGEPPQLIIAGTASRGDQAPPGVRSLVMRAKLAGFRFGMHDGVLAALRSGEQATNY